MSTSSIEADPNKDQSHNIINARSPVLNWNQIAEHIYDQLLEHHSGPKLRSLRFDNIEYFDSALGINRFLPFNTHIELLYITKGSEETNEELTDPWCYVQIQDNITFPTISQRLSIDKKLSTRILRGYVRLSDLYLENKLISSGAKLYLAQDGESASEIARKHFEFSPGARYPVDAYFYASVLLHINNPYGKLTYTRKSFNPATGDFDLDEVYNSPFVPMDSSNPPMPVSIYDVIGSDDFYYNYDVANRTYDNWITYLKTKDGSLKDINPDNSKVNTQGTTSPVYIWIPTPQFAESLREIVDQGTSYSLIESVRHTLDTTWPVGWGVNLSLKLGLGIGLPSGMAKISGTVGGELTLIRPDDDHLKIVSKATLGASAEADLVPPSTGALMGSGEASEAISKRDRTGNLGEQAEFKFHDGFEMFYETEFTFPLEDDNAIASILFGFFGLIPGASPVTFVAKAFVSALSDLNIDVWAFQTKWSAGIQYKIGFSISFPGLSTLSTPGNSKNQNVNEVKSFWNSDSITGGETEKEKAKRSAFDMQSLAVLGVMGPSPKFNPSLCLVYKYEVQKKYKKGIYAYDADTGLRCPYEVTTVHSIDAGGNIGATGNFTNFLSGMIDYNAIGEFGGGYELSTVSKHGDTDHPTRRTSYFGSPDIQDPTVFNFTRVTNSNPDTGSLLFESKIGIDLKMGSIPQDNSDFKDIILGFKIEKFVSFQDVGFSRKLGDIIKKLPGAETSLSVGGNSGMIVRLEAANVDEVKSLVDTAINDENIPPPTSSQGVDLILHYSIRAARLFVNFLAPSAQVTSPLGKDYWDVKRVEFAKHLKLAQGNGVEFTKKFGFNVAISDIPIPFLSLFTGSIEIGASILWMKDYNGLTDSQKEIVDQLFSSEEIGNVRHSIIESLASWSPLDLVNQAVNEN